MTDILPISASPLGTFYHSALGARTMRPCIPSLTVTLVGIEATRCTGCNEMSDGKSRIMGTLAHIDGVYVLPWIYDYTTDKVCCHYGARFDYLTNAVYATIYPTADCSGSPTGAVAKKSVYISVLLTRQSHELNGIIVYVDADNYFGHWRFYVFATGAYGGVYPPTIYGTEPLGSTLDNEITDCDWTRETTPHTSAAATGGTMTVIETP